MALAYVKEHKEDFVDLGEAGFTELLNLLGAGAKNKAREHFIRTKLGPDGLIAMMQENNKAMQAAVEQKAKLEDQFISFLAHIGTIGVNLLRVSLLGV